MAKQSDDYDTHDPDWLRDQLRQRDRVIAELKSEQDEATDLIRRFREQAEDFDATLESWREAFDMELNDDGTMDVEAVLGRALRSWSTTTAIW